MINIIEETKKITAKFHAQLPLEVDMFLKNTHEFSISLEKGIIYEKIGNIDYPAIPNIFYGTEGILNSYKYPTLSNEESEEERKYFLPFAEDISGRNLFFICLKQENFGKIVFHEADYIFDSNFKQGTWIISSSPAQFLSQLIQQNSNNPEVGKIQEIFKNIL